jgi:hypothetical protein
MTGNGRYEEIIDAPEPGPRKQERQYSKTEKGVTVDDFHAYMPSHLYLYEPTREQWPASSVNARIPPIPVFTKNGNRAVDKKGKPPKLIKASSWLDRNKPIEQMTWAPGQPTLIKDRLIAEGGWIERNGVTTFNLYRPPTIKRGLATQAGPWIEHMQKVFNDDSSHIISWLARRSTMRSCSAAAKVSVRTRF